MTRTNNRANRAKANEAKNVKNAAKQVKTIEATAAAVIEEVADVETIETQAEANAAAVVSLPITTETATESDKVTSKEVLKAAGSLRSAVKEERRGANVTIRLIAERAAAGDAAAVDIICALCDVPRAALFSLNLDSIRSAVNAWYPYYVEKDARRVNVRPGGVWYTEKAEAAEATEAAAKRVKRGYRAVVVVDYLDALIKAAKSRAKGVRPRCIDCNAIYTDCKMSAAADGITAAEIDEAKERRTYSETAANVWRRDRNGFYI